MFTDISLCKRVLRSLKDLLVPGGKFVFAVNTVADKCADDDYKTSISVKTKEGFDLVLKTKNYYDEHSQTQFSPGIYELYNGGELLRSEYMDFRTLLLYKCGEIEQYLRGGDSVITYSSFRKETTVDDKGEMFFV